MPSRLLSSTSRRRRRSRGADGSRTVTTVPLRDAVGSIARSAPISSGALAHDLEAVGVRRGAAPSPDAVVAHHDLGVRRVAPGSAPRWTRAPECRTALVIASWAIRSSSASTSVRSRRSARRRVTRIGMPELSLRWRASPPRRCPGCRWRRPRSAGRTERRTSPTTRVIRSRRIRSWAVWASVEALRGECRRRGSRARRSSWATPSCISRASRRRSSVVAASRNRPNSSAVSSWTAVRSSAPGQALEAGLEPTVSGCRPSASRPETTATSPASVSSGKRERAAVAASCARDSQASAASASGVARRRRAESPGSRHAAGLRSSPCGTCTTSARRPGSSSRTSTGDRRRRGSTGSRPRAEPAGERPSARGSAAGRCGTASAGRRRGVPPRAQEAPDQAEADAGDHPGEGGRRPRSVLSAAVQDQRSGDDQQATQLGGQRPAAAPRAAPQVAAVNAGITSAPRTAERCVEERGPRRRRPHRPRRSEPR